MLTSTEQQLIDVAHNCGITDNLELAHLLATCNHESANFTTYTESLNYSSAGLLQTFPKYFTPETAQRYGRNKDHKADQQAIAAIVYGKRMGNTPANAFAYRGRGMVQLTGHDNYAAFQVWLNSHKYAYNVIDHPNLVAELPLAALSACWFWITNKCAKPAMLDDCVSVCRIVNNGSNGLNERKKLTAHYKAELS